MSLKKNQKWTNLLAILTGLFVLLSGFSDNAILLRLRGQFIHWAMLLFALLLFFAILDFIVSRVRNIGNSNDSIINNLVCFASFIAVLVLGLFEGFEGPRFWELTFNIQSAVEASLAGLICLSLICALFRLPRWKKSRLTSSFVISLFVFLILYSGILSFSHQTVVIRQIIEWVKCIPLGGIYGLLLGIALGGRVSGIRYIFLGEHPYLRKK